MKKIILVAIAIFAIDLCVGQDLKVVGGDKIKINVQRGESKWFDVSFKNVSNKTVFIKNIRCDKSELSIPKLATGQIDSGDKNKYKFRIAPKHSGKQQFSVYVDYEDKNGNKGKTYFRVSIDPKY